MNSKWTPYREPLWVTLTRTVVIAMLVGAVIARGWGGISRWPVATLIALWPSLGGHWIELAFLNGVRPRIHSAWIVQVGVRLAVWFVGGVCLGSCMRLTAQALAGTRLAHGLSWWQMGLAFISIEMVVHLVLQLCGRPSAYNGRG